MLRRTIHPKFKIIGTIHNLVKINESKILKSGVEKNLCHRINIILLLSLLIKNVLQYIVEIEIILILLFKKVSQTLLMRLLYCNTKDVSTLYLVPDSQF